MCAQLPVFVASWPEGVYFSCERLLRKKLYGEACEAVCHSRVGFFVVDAFGYHEFQSGSSATFELRRIAWRFFGTFWKKLCVQSTWPLWMAGRAESFDEACVYSRHGIFGEPAFQYFGFLLKT